MYELTVKNSFSSAHSIPDYDGKCARLHGHTWQVEVAVRGKHLDRKGMLVDFRKIKSGLDKIVTDLDHQYLNDLKIFKEEGINPTAENLAKYIYISLKEMINNYDVKLTMVRVWESPSASASYWEVD
ncbi:MAG: 6-carboxy-5,6,7,8-tetrahydropterin synthase [Pelotomaculum thermopropionicum]|uniref:6-carboxy-5,6,7,8-tetrahydropterin synthase n=1 Tax=Pelotomaculum thermopropionicum TaxID=110500 RepID=A0A101HVP7_9FIRM|nr:MAG: 6-carboxy-5,6,7,8-tetrahydropterin synthase [Pelotomaculum thermopropionicum]